MRLTLFLDHACNLRCTYCYNGRKFHRPMPPDVVRRAVDFGFQHPDPQLLVSFFGGEPLLDVEQLADAVGYAREQAQVRGKTVAFSVATNGTLLDERRLQVLKENAFKVQVSLDGCRAAHDATRRTVTGESSYAVIAANVQRLLAEGFRPRVVAVVDPANARLLPDSFDALADLGVRNIYLAPNVLGAWDEAACATFEEALVHLGERYLARLRSGQDVRLDPLNGKMVTHLEPGCGESVQCAFGREELAISPTGRIYPCDRLVREDGDATMCLGDIWTGVDEARRTQLLEDKQSAQDPECDACEFHSRCNRWCGCANYETTGHPGHVSALTCWFERCFITEADRVANTLYAERNPAFLKRFYLREPLVRLGRH